MMTNSNEEFFGVQFKHTNDETNIKDFFLIIYPTKLKFNVLIIEQEIGGEIAKLAIYHANDYKFLTSGDFSLNSTENEAAVDRSCFSKSNTFNECFGCSMAVFASDPVITAACIVAPWSWRPGPCNGASLIRRRPRAGFRTFHWRASGLPAF
jgi:hypothetical protein